MDEFSIAIGNIFTKDLTKISLNLFGTNINSFNFASPKLV